MNILFLTAEYNHPFFAKTGGIGAFIAVLARGLSQRGNKVCVIMLVKTKTRPFRHGRVIIVPVALPELLSNVFRYSFLLERIKFLLPATIAMARLQRIAIGIVCNKILARLSPDVVETNDYLGLFNQVNIGEAKLVARIHGSYAVLRSFGFAVPRIPTEIQERKAMSRADGIVAVSGAALDYARAVFVDAFGRGSLRSGVIYNPISEAFRSTTTCSEDVITIGYFGSISSLKGIEDFVQVVEHLRRTFSSRKIVCRVIGKVIDPIEHKRLMSLGDIVNYSDHMTAQQLSDEVGKFTFACFMSGIENCPLAWIEAMSSGVPLLTRNIPVSNELVVLPSTGRVISAENLANENAMSEIVRDLIENRKFYSKNSLQFSRKFKLDVISKENELFYRELSGKNENCFY